MRLPQSSAKSVASRPRSRGFGLMELVVVLTLMGVLMALLLPALGRARRAGESSQCLSNLRQLLAGFYLYADDHEGFAPDEWAEQTWDALLQAYVSDPGVFVCPADETALGQAMELSYAWRDSFEVNDARASLAGRRLSTAGPPSLLVVFEALPDWHEVGRINAAPLDGAIRSCEVAEYEANLAQFVQ